MTNKFDPHDRTLWGDGPWQYEPDVTFGQYSPEQGAPAYTWIVARNPEMGNLCGYVGLPDGHILVEKGYDLINDQLSDDCLPHGGLTFSSRRGPDWARRYGLEPHSFDGMVWWVGFDAGHAFDLMPVMNAMNDWFDQYHADNLDPHDAQIRAWKRDHPDVYRTMSYMESECRKLIRCVNRIRLAGG